jgi:hypothetical protein
MPCNATFKSAGLITPPYEQGRVMRSADPLALVRATPGIEHCA